jgi:hypothetical protein
MFSCCFYAAAVVIGRQNSAMTRQRRLWRHAANATQDVDCVRQSVPHINCIVDCRIRHIRYVT